MASSKPQEPMLDSTGPILVWIFLVVVMFVASAVMIQEQVVELPKRPPPVAAGPSAS